MACPRPWDLGCLALLTLLAAPAGAAAPPSPKPAPETLYEAVDVTVASVEVFVTDREGKPVSGLTRDDFEIREEGRPVEITHFLAESAASGEGGGPAAATAPASPPAAAPASTERTWAWFFDNLHLDPTSRLQVLDKLPGAGAKLSAQDRVVLFGYDRTLTMQIFRASDREAIAAAIAKMRARIPGGFEVRAAEDELQRRSAAANDASDRRTIGYDMELQQEELLHELKAALEALERAMTALAGLPGTKALVYITGNLPNWNHPSFRSYIDRAVNQANANRVTLYGVGVPSRGDPYDQTGSLLQLADRTGGRAALDPFDAGVLLEQMRTDLTTFYSLGYTPPPQKAGTMRRLKIAVKRPGLTVRHRATYQAHNEDEIAQSRMWTALFLGEGQNGLGISATLGAAHPGAQGNLTVDLRVELPVGRLGLLPSGAARTGKVHLFIASRNAKGKTSDLTRITLPLRIPEEKLAAALAGKIPYDTRIALRPEASDVVVGVYDEVGKADSVLVLPWRPGP